jgi:hypothetical protein
MPNYVSPTGTERHSNRVLSLAAQPARKKQTYQARNDV